MCAFQVYDDIVEDISRLFSALLPVKFPHLFFIPVKAFKAGVFIQKPIQFSSRLFSVRR